MKNRRFKSFKKSCDQAVFECERFAVEDWQQKNAWLKVIIVENKEREKMA